MSDGLKTVTLDTICSRGPWKNKVERDPSDRWSLTGDEVHALYKAVGEGREEMLRVLSVSDLSTRKANKALQLLRKAGLIVFDLKFRVWRYS
jgi:hypothetical protein